MSPSSSSTGRPSDGHVAGARTIPYELILDNGCELAALIDPGAGRVLWISLECSRLLGYSLAEVAAAEPLDFIHPEERQAVRHRLKRGDWGAHLVRMRSRGGRDVWVEYRIVPVRDGEARRYLVVSGRDVTQRVAAEARAVETAAYYRSLVESSPDGILVRRGPEVIYANPASAVLLGYPPGSDALVGLCAVDLIAPHCRDEARLRMAAFDDSPHGQKFEQDLLRADGSLLAVEATVSPIVFEDHACSHFIFRDISERVRQRRALRANEAALRRNEARLRQFAGGLIEAQEGERRRIAGELHDDLSQQLAALTQRIELLRDPGCDADLDELLEISRSVAWRAHDLAYELHPSIVEHVGLVAAMRAHVKTVSRRGLSVDFEPGEVPEALPAAIGLCLYRVMQEALRNVAQHARTDRATVTVSARDGAIMLTIRDRGRGFEVSGAEADTGLGLMSMRERARLVSGQVLVRSAPGSGTVVEMTVPVPATPPPGT